MSLTISKSYDITILHRLTGKDCRKQKQKAKPAARLEPSSSLATDQVCHIWPWLTRTEIREVMAACERKCGRKEAPLSSRRLWQGHTQVSPLNKGNRTIPNCVRSLYVLATASLKTMERPSSDTSSIMQKLSLDFPIKKYPR